MEYGIVLPQQIQNLRRGLPAILEQTMSGPLSNDVYWLLSTMNWLSSTRSSLPLRNRCGLRTNNKFACKFACNCT